MRGIFGAFGPKKCSSGGAHPWNELADHRTASGGFLLAWCEARTLSSSGIASSDEGADQGAKAPSKSPSATEKVAADAPHDAAPDAAERSIYGCLRSGMTFVVVFLSHASPFSSLIRTSMLSNELASALASAFGSEVLMLIASKFGVIPSLACSSCS